MHTRLERILGFSLLFRLSTGKQSKVYLPEHPFPHAEVLKYCVYLAEFGFALVGF